MPRARLRIKDQQGFSIVEVLLAAAIFGFIVTGLVGAIVYGRSSSADAGDHSRALFLAEEGIEATRNIAAASYANIDSSATTVGDTAIEASTDFNAGGASAYKVATGATGGTVSSISVYITSVDATNNHIQVGVYADIGGTAGVRLGVSGVQVAVPNSWNTFPISGLSVSPTTNYWIGLSEDGTTRFAGSATGGTSIYRVTGGYPAPNPFAADSTVDTWKLSLYMSLGASSTYGLAQVGNQWAFSGTSDTTGIYTRQVTIAPAGTNRKTVTSTVTWPQLGGGTGSATAISQLVNWAAATKLWTNATLAGSTDVTGTNNAVKTEAVGDYAYTVLSAATSNFAVSNISNPAAPTNLSTITLAGTPTNIFVSGNYAYITNASDTAELQVVDISNPALPVLKASVDMVGTGNGLGVYVSGNYAYVTRAADITANANELTVVNVTTPISPTVAGGYNSTLTFNEVYVSGTNAYVATSSTAIEMQTFSVAVPATPTLTSSYNAPTLTAALAITGFGNTILLGTGATLNLVNVTAPATPVSLGSFTAAGTVNDVDFDITNKFAFLGTSGIVAELQVVNIAAPAAPTLAKTVDVPGLLSTVAGVSYDSSLDSVVGASASDTQEVMVFTRN
jgi:Tfp pilus assembly protein PilV